MSDWRSKLASLEKKIEEELKVPTQEECEELCEIGVALLTGGNPSPFVRELIASIVKQYSEKGSMSPKQYAAVAKHLPK